MTSDAYLTNKTFDTAIDRYLTETDPKPEFISVLPAPGWWARRPSTGNPGITTQPLIGWGVTADGTSYALVHLGDGTGLSAYHLTTEPDFAVFYRED